MIEWLFSKGVMTRWDVIVASSIGFAVGASAPTSAVISIILVWIVVGIWGEAE